MMGDVVNVSLTCYIWVVKQMYQLGDITLEQYAGCLRRAKERMGV